MKLRKWMNKFGTFAMTGVAALALMVTASGVNTACYWYFGQDEMPKGADKLRRF